MRFQNFLLAILTGIRLSAFPAPTTALTLAHPSLSGIYLPHQAPQSQQPVLTVQGGLPPAGHLQYLTPGTDAWCLYETRHETAAGEAENVFELLRGMETPGKRETCGTAPVFRFVLAVPPRTYIIENVDTGHCVTLHTHTLLPHLVPSTTCNPTNTSLFWDLEPQARGITVAGGVASQENYLIRRWFRGDDRISMQSDDRMQGDRFGVQTQQEEGGYVAVEERSAWVPWNQLTLKSEPGIFTVVRS